MFEEGEEAKAFGGGRKLTKTERFRDRLLRKADKSDKPQTLLDVNREEALNDFLKSPQEGDILPPFPSPLRKPVPRINLSTSPRWTGGENVSNNGGSGHHGAGGDEISPDYTPRPSRRKGLNVSFAQSAPQIIGEGGDEAEAPTISISEKKSSYSAHTLAEQAGKSHLGSASSDVDYPASSLTGEGFRPPPLARAPTGFGDTTSGHSPLTPSSWAEDANSELTMAGGGTTSAQHGLGLLPSPSAGRRRQMREEEARAFTSGLRDPSPEPSSLERPSTPPRQNVERLPSTPTMSNFQPAHSPSASSDHLLSPGKSPSQSRPSSSSSRESNAIRSTAKLSLDMERANVGAGSQVNRPPKRKPVPRAPATQSKEDVLDEFRAHARRYYGLFVLAAEKMGPGLAAPLSRWIRAASWWFLTAEANFKLLRKELQEGVTIQQITSGRRLMQALVDLSKTAWILEDMVREYAEAEAIDLSTPESVDSLIQNATNSRFSRTLLFWKDLSSRFGSLVAAVRRNGFMTAASENLPLSAGIDTSIWHIYSALDPRISNWLRSASPSWVKMDDSMASAEPMDLAKVIPLANTGDIFRIRSAFCHISGGFQDGKRSQNIPCMLTVGRRRGSYALVLFIASQDHGINVVIETDPVRGDGLEWQQNGTSVLFNFADGFLLLIHLQQPDYIHVKEIYDLTLRALTATTRNSLMAADHGEQLIFRATCKTFERKSTQRIPSFPYEGEQQDCEVLLFERYDVVKNTSPPRRSSLGLRLSVMLSPHASNLGILNVPLGGEKPILVHTLHELNPPRLELLDPYRASLIVQFFRKGDFNQFYQLLTCLDYSENDENASVKVPLRSFSIEPSTDEAHTFLAGINWTHVQISTEKVGGHNVKLPGRAVLSPSINLSVFSQEMVMADKIFQGRSQVRLGLGIAEPTSIWLLGSGQKDLRVIVRFRTAASNTVTVADQVLARSKSHPTVWKYVFASAVELHAFERYLTGADVLFDGVASSFNVNRSSGLRARKEEFGATRLQLLHNGWEQPWQILAFFEDGRAMSFGLDSSDVAECYSSSGKNKFSIRLLEAKVSLPAEIAKEELRGFLCADDVAEGEERDDIAITFEVESVRDQLAQVLPASVKKMSSLMGALHLK